MIICKYDKIVDGSLQFTKSLCHSFQVKSTQANKKFFVKTSIQLKHNFLSPKINSKSNKTVYLISVQYFNNKMPFEIMVCATDLFTTIELVNTPYCFKLEH